MLYVVAVGHLCSVAEELTVFHVLHCEKGANPILVTNLLFEIIGSLSFPNSIVTNAVRHLFGGTRLGVRLHEAVGHGNAAVLDVSASVVDILSVQSLCILVSVVKIIEIAFFKEAVCACLPEGAVSFRMSKILGVGIDDPL
jgi:hypothetical protein